MFNVHDEIANLCVLKSIVNDEALFLEVIPTLASVGLGSEITNRCDN